MSRCWDIDPGDINPDTGLPYPGYSSPSLDTSFHDMEFCGADFASSHDITVACLVEVDSTGRSFRVVGVKESTVQDPEGIWHDVDDVTVLEWA